MSERWWIVSLLFLGAIINYIDRGNLSIAAPTLMREFGRSPAAMGTLLSAFFWTYALLQIPAGYIVDRFDLKWTYGTAFLLWSLSSAAIGVAHSFAQLLTLRILLGAAEAIAVPASLAYIKQNFRSQDQGWPTGIFTAGMIMGPAIGSFVGGLLMAHYGWRFLFMSTGLGACFWLLPWFGLARKTYSRPNAQAPSSSRITAHWKQFFKLRVTWAITIGSFFYAYYWYFCLTWLPSYFLMARGFSFIKMGTFTAAPLIVMAIMTPLCGRAADFLIAGARSPLVVRKTFVCCGFALGSSVIAVLLVRSSAGLMAILALSFFGLGLASANFWALTQTICPSSIVGTAIGYQNGVANFAGVSAPIFTGWLITRTRSFSLAITFAGVALLIAAGIYMYLIREADLIVTQGQFD